MGSVSQASERGRGTQRKQGSAINAVRVSRNEPRLLVGFYPGSDDNPARSKAGMNLGAGLVRFYPGLGNEVVWGRTWAVLDICYASLVMTWRGRRRSRGWGRTWGEFGWVLAGFG